MLKTYQTLSVYFDNDNGGATGLQAIRATGINVTDCSGLYKPYKDLNDYLTKYFLKL